MIESTLYAWSTALGIDRQQLQRALQRNDVRVEPKKKISARDIFNAITGDKEAAMTRKLLAEAEEKERENRMASGEIITVEDALAIYTGKVSAIVQKLDALTAVVPGLTFEQRQLLAQAIETIKAQGREA